jgi:translocation protein SEC63
MTAMEFITLPTPSDHSVPMEELRKQVLRWQPELKEKTKFWQRKASVLKVRGWEAVAMCWCAA